MFGGMYLMTAGVALMPFLFSLQDAGASPQSQASAEVDAARLVAKGTPVEIAIDTDLDSKANKPGDWFPIRLIDDLTDADGAVLIPAGTKGQGQIVHAAKARGGGKAGELIANARYLTCGNAKIPLGYLKLSMSGVSRAGTATRVSAVAGLTGGVAAFIITGGQVHVPAGTQAQAKVTADTALTDADRAACLTAPSPSGGS